MTEQDEQKKPPYGALVIIGDAEYPVVWGDVTARQVGEMRLLFGFPPRALATAIDEDTVDLPELAALAYLSCRQQGQDVDPARFLDSITESMPVRIIGLRAPTASVAEDADPEA